MINSNDSIARTQLQDLQQNNPRGVIPTFAVMHPLSAALELPVIDAGPGFDVLDLEARLGPTRFNKLMAGLKQVFVANHRTYPDGHELAGYETHCVYVEDVEAFLTREGQ
jgi:hypothetical protein